MARSRCCTERHKLTYSLRSGCPPRKFSRSETMAERFFISRTSRDPYAAQRVVEDEQVRGSEQTHDYGKGTLIERLPWIRPEAGSAGRTCCEAKRRPRKCMAT
jgi:hypothetical protein